jgi:hypothetical protein
MARKAYHSALLPFLTSHAVTEPEFRTFFSQFGELHEAFVMFDRDTKTSRGFGFVTYVDPVRSSFWNARDAIACAHSCDV